jgi:CheY-like chemotaxis protein
MLLDLVMPEMDGFQVLHEKSLDPDIRDIPVIVVSSQNPRGESNVSKTFTVARGDGLSAYDLLTCIQSVTEILVPEERTADLRPAGTTGETPVS